MAVHHGCQERGGFVVSRPDVMCRTDDLRSLGILQIALVHDADAEVEHRLSVLATQRELVGQMIDEPIALIRLKRTVAQAQPQVARTYGRLASVAIVWQPLHLRKASLLSGAIEWRATGQANRTVGLIQRCKEARHHEVIADIPRPVEVRADVNVKRRG